MWIIKLEEPLHFLSNMMMHKKKIKKKQKKKKTPLDHSLVSSMGKRRHPNYIFSPSRAVMSHLPMSSTKALLLTISVLSQTSNRRLTPVEKHNNVLIIQDSGHHIHSSTWRSGCGKLPCILFFRASLELAKHILSEILAVPGHLSEREVMMS